MSEKEVRETLQVLIDEYMKEYYNDMVLTAVQEVLAQPPDVVAVVRWLKHQSKIIPGNTLIDRSWQRAYEAAIIHIEREFHVRLTDDGWEWTKCERVLGAEEK